MRPYRIARLASGSGSTAEAFIRSVQANAMPIEIPLVISNNKDAYILERVKNLNDELGLVIQTAIINSRTQSSDEKIVHGQQTEAEQDAILDMLQTNDIDLVLLLGYVKLVGPKLIAAYGWRPEYTSVYQSHMLNTHPGLLPKSIGTHGLGTQQFVLDNKQREAGQTLHVVSAEYDKGPIIAENRVPVKMDDTAESLFARVQATEKAHIAADVMSFLEA
ncbi:hypothetical protein IPL68_01525 [Candidatus Saccharibacteria bacterium]|nr:MAG: hypothetical protein IPL68_01525 [Candidatus Saccharibacteria bacterium]